MILSLDDIGKVRMKMTNETIFYIIGLVLGLILGYAARCLIESKQTIKIALVQKENAENERREAD